MSFVHFPQRPAALTGEFAAAEYEKLAERSVGAEASALPEQWLSLFRDWNALTSYVRSEEDRLHFGHTRDMRDEAAAEAERRFREEVLPRAEEGESRLIAALLGSHHRGAIAAAFGERLLRVLEVSQASLEPVNSQLRVEVRALADEYIQRLTSAEVSVGGQAMTLSRARGLSSSEDAELRREAFHQYYGWFRDQREELAGIFSQMVRRRHAMGESLGHENFVPVGYSDMQRADYGPEQVRQFRDAVRAHISPLFRELAKEQAAALGTPSLRPWDMAYNPATSLPQGVTEPIAEQLDKAERVFARLSPQLCSHFRRMREQGTIDLENRAGKAGGGYCTAFHDSNQVVVFGNSVGNDDDVRLLTHEMGHAFQAWESQRIEAVMLRWPAADAAEVHSMTLEFLSLPYLGEFFSPPELERFTRGRWTRAVEVLCYACVVDHFQHWVYTHPGASAEERDRQWAALYDDYMPGVDWSGEAESYRSCRWYAQRHIFHLPFYFIDYAIAETGAMQFARLAHADFEDALGKYLELCRLGGTGGVIELLAAVGMRSPFDAGVMSELGAHVRSVLARGPVADPV